MLFYGVPHVERLILREPTFVADDPNEDVAFPQTSL
jgi:hypothetical protein